MLKQFVDTVKKFGLLKDNDRVIIAVSGGADSVALVHLLNKAKKRWRLYLHLAHLNHMLRRHESNRDEQFVEDLAERLKLPLTRDAVDVRKFAQENRLSLEDAARRIRYDFLLKAARANFAAKIALGHTRDDQAETVLMRFLRGSGISGLRGIPAKRKIEEVWVVRPLLELSHAQIVDFLAKRDIPFCLDSSNLNNAYFRNRIRNYLIPILEAEFNPKIREILANLADNIGADFDFLQKISREKFKILRVNHNDSGIVSFKIKKFNSLHKALQKLLLRLAINELKGNVRRIDFRHWKELEDLIASRPPDSIVDLPAGICAVKKKDNIVFYKRDLK